MSGDIMPIQIIDRRWLPAEENLWLKCLSEGLNLEETKEISEEMARQDKAAPIAAYRDAIIRANPGIIQEAFMGKKSSLTIEQVIENVGLGAKWEARARAEAQAEAQAEKLQIASNFKRMGLSVSQIAEGTGLSTETIKQLQ